MPGTLEKLDEMLGIWQPKMYIEWRKEMLLQHLDWLGLEGWFGANYTSAHTLFTEYHDIFSLEPGELGCTSLAKHEIWVVECEDKKRFLSIAPHTRGHWESHRDWVLLLPGPESRFLADCHGQSIKTVHSLHSGEPRIFWVWTHALQVVWCPCNLPPSRG